jgi:serine protease
MRIIGTAILLLIGIATAQGQVKTSSRYALPQGISHHDYVAGSVLVKVKEEYKTIFLNSGASAARSTLRMGSVRPLMPTAAVNRNAARALAFQPAIDISLYYEIHFDPSQSVEDYINTLCASGYIEYAEPVFRERIQMTVNDPLQTSQYYLGLIRAYDAWDITQGSEDIVIAIIDSGGDLDHPDLASQLYINTADPVNGADDDGNGYIDDYRGWDFSGDDTLNIYDPSFTGDNDPSIFKDGPGFTHGTAVGACASASTNDGTGIAGVGFKSKLLFTKHYADNQKANSLSYNSNLYAGILYTAQQGAQIINCSWGSGFRSQIQQDVITHVTLDLGCLVVAAAGNSNSSTPLYPAAYDYVLSVANCDQNDKRAPFSNYGSTIDITAPGVAIFTAFYNDAYGTNSGTSFSSPIVAGAAALLLAHKPDFSPLQLAEQLRVTADEALYTQNPTFIHKLGKGRLDIFNALSAESPSIRALNYALLNETGASAIPGEEAFLSFDFINYLQSSSAGLSIEISTTSPYVAITKNKIDPGTIASGATVNNKATPFEMSISTSVPENVAVELLITYSDGAYQDYQMFSFVPNPSYRNIDDNQVLTTISSSGRLGYENPGSSSGGYGFVFNDQSILYEMGIIMGRSSSSVLNTVRSTGGSYDADFVSLSRIQEIVPGERSYSEIFGDFSNSTSAASQTAIISYRSLVWREAPYDKFVIIEYTIKNPTASPLSNFHFGIFADWDISFGGGQDAARWNDAIRLGYVFPKQSSTLPHAGIQLLTGSGDYYAIDNDASISGNPFGLYDGFTDTEKFTSISTDRLEAGNTTASGNDVSHVVSAGPYTINPDEEITLAFALHAANSLTDLIMSAQYADSLYNYTLTAARPVVDTVETCEGCSATLIASGATAFKWYKNFTGGEPVATGSQLTLDQVFNDTTLYVSNAEKSFESVRTPAFINVTSITGTEEPLTHHVSVYPIPSRNGKITVAIDGIATNTLQLTLLNAQGRKVYDRQYSVDLQQHFSTTLETAQYVPGMYVLLIRTGHQAAVKKVILNR